MSVNRVQLIGNLGKDPELRMAGETAVITLPLATSETYKGEKQTEWHNVVFWGKTAEVVNKYLKKGNQIYVEGRLKTRKWTDKEGNDHYQTEIHAQSMVMLGGKKTEQKTEADVHTEAEVNTIDKTDLPF